MTAPLQGLRILDFTIALAGPLATSRLGDLGADVIKIESPQGDFSRQWPLNGYSHGNDSSAFLMLNRNKRSLVLDLKSPEARPVVERLVAGADVLVQNFRPGVVERLGIDFAAMSKLNPQLVYVSVSGYGDTGPMVGAPGQDLLVQCFSGLTYNAGTADGLPHPSPVYLVDNIASHLAAEAVMAGYIDRLRTGHGKHFKVSLLAAALESQIQEISVYLTSGRGAVRSAFPFASAWMEAPYGIYRTADHFIAIAHARLPVLADLFGDQRLSEVDANQPSFDDDAGRRAFRDQVAAIVQENFVKKTTDAWLDYLSEHDVWVGPVLNHAAVAEHPQMADLFTTVSHPAGPYRTLARSIRYDGETEIKRAPNKGEHVDEIIAEIGLADRLNELRADGVLG